MGAGGGCVQLGAYSSCLQGVPTSQDTRIGPREPLTIRGCLQAGCLQWVPTAGCQQWLPTVGAYKPGYQIWSPRASHLQRVPTGWVPTAGAYSWVPTVVAYSRLLHTPPPPRDLGEPCTTACAETMLTHIRLLQPPAH